MFDWFFERLDPKILKMEEWVNRQVVEPDKIDIDLDKVGVDEIRPNDRFRALFKSETLGVSMGPFLVNCHGARLLGYLKGEGRAEAFALLSIRGNIYWRHRESGTTEDFLSPAFDDMQGFHNYISPNEDYWQMVLRTQAYIANTHNVYQPSLHLSEIKSYMELNGAYSERVSETIRQH